MSFFSGFFLEIVVSDPFDYMMDDLLIQIKTAYLFKRADTFVCDLHAHRLFSHFDCVIKQRSIILFALSCHVLSMEMTNAVIIPVSLSSHPFNFYRILIFLLKYKTIP